MRLIIAKAGLLYFLCVFSIGFLLGSIRVLFVTPAIGERYAELFEIPVMLAVVFYSARYIRHRFHTACAGSFYHFAIGTVAFGTLVFFEVLVVWIQERELYEYLHSRDPIAFGAYLISLLVYWLMPWILFKCQTSNTSDQ